MKPLRDGVVGSLCNHVLFEKEQILKHYSPLGVLQIPLTVPKEAPLLSVKVPAEQANRYILSQYSSIFLAACNIETIYIISFP